MGRLAGADGLHTHTFYKMTPWLRDVSDVDE